MSRPPSRGLVRPFGLAAALVLMVVPSVMLVGVGPGVWQAVLLGLVAAGMVLAILAG